MEDWKNQRKLLDVVEVSEGYGVWRLIALRAVIKITALLVIAGFFYWRLSSPEDLAPVWPLQVALSNGIPLLFCFPLPLLISPVLSKVITPNSKLLPRVYQVVYDAALQFALALPCFLFTYRDQASTVCTVVACFLTLLLPILVVTDYTMCARHEFHRCTIIIPVVYSLLYWRLGSGHALAHAAKSTSHSWTLFLLIIYASKYAPPYVIGFFITWCLRKIKAHGSTSSLPQ